MPKIFQFQKRDKAGTIKNAGRMEIKNQTENSADLYFYGDIVSTSYNPDDWWSSGNPEDKAPQDVVDFLNQLDGKTNVNIHVNSGGGDALSGVAIYNILKNNKAYKTSYIEGLGASAASIIPLAADKIIIYSSAQFMVHLPWTFAYGNSNDFRKTIDMLDSVTQSLMSIYMEHVKEGVTEEQIKQLLDNETWLTGKQAQDYFNIEVEETKNAVAYANSEFFNMYKHTPKDLIKIEPQQPQNPNDEIVKALKNITDRLDKLENPPQNTTTEPQKPSNEEIIKQLKAKLSLQIAL